MLLRTYVKQWIPYALYTKSKCLSIFLSNLILFHCTVQLDAIFHVDHITFILFSCIAKRVNKLHNDLPGSCKKSISMKINDEKKMFYLILVVRITV